MTYSYESTSRFLPVQIEDKTYQVHLNDIGQGQETIVMLHGSGPGANGWSNFNKNVDHFVNLGYRVVLLDCLGWGESDSILCAGSRSHLNAEQLKQVLDQLGIEKAHLVGNSMGAHSCTVFTLLHPERVNKLILMGGGTGGVSLFTPMPAEGIKQIQKVYRQPTLEHLKDLMNVFIYDASQMTEELLQGRLKNILSNQEHLDNFIGSFKANPKQFPDVSAQLDQIQHKTLIVWGRDDRFLPLDIGLRLLSLIKDSQMHIFNRCGHWAQWEHAADFNALLTQFLEDQK